MDLNAVFWGRKDIQACAETDSPGSLSRLDEGFLRKPSSYGEIHPKRRKIIVWTVS
jgi:hypothetical protein